MENLQTLKKNLEMKPIRPQNVIANWEKINVICNQLIDSLSEKEEDKKRLFETTRDIVRGYLTKYNKTGGRSGIPKETKYVVERSIGKLKEILDYEKKNSEVVRHPSVEIDPKRPNSALAALLEKSESGSSRGSSPNSVPDSSRDSPLPITQFNIPEGADGESKKDKERQRERQREIQRERQRERKRQIEQRSQRLAEQVATNQEDDGEKTTCSGSGCVITGGRKKKTRRKRKRKRKKKTKRKRRARGRKTRKNILTIFNEGRGIKKTPRRRGSSNYTQKHKPSPKVMKAFHKSNR